MDMISVPGRQNGVALIIVLMIVALVTVMATEMAGRLQLQVKRASNIKDNNQAYWYAMGAEQFARKSIGDLIEVDPDVVNLEQPWSQEFTYPLAGGGIQAQLVDTQGCFNLNALREESKDPTVPTDNKVLNAFKDMLVKAEIGIDDYDAEKLTDSIADWLDEDSNLRQSGSEDADYQSLVHPYLAANNFMASKSELRLVNGIQQKWLEKLLPLVCIIPGSDLLRVNINTIEPENAAVLAGLSGMTLADAQSEISTRGEEGYEKIEDFFQQPAIAALEVGSKFPEWFDVKTNYFTLNIKTRYNDASFAMSTLFEVDEKTQEVRVIKREFGGVL